MVKKICLIIILGFLLTRTASVVGAKSLDEEIADLTKQISDLENAIGPLRRESADLRVKISRAKNQITLLGKQISDLGEKLIERQADVEVQKILLGERAKKLYINSKMLNPLLILLGNPEGLNIVRSFSWYSAVIAADKQAIGKYVVEISRLEQNKINLENNKTRLLGLKTTLEGRFGFLTGEIEKAEEYKSELSRRQQRLIAEKTAMFNTNVGDVSTDDDPAARVDFNPGFSPAFAAFSFGAPHRKGMSQYGTYARAKNGQSAEQILRAYYGDIRLEKVDTAGSIKTSVGTLPFEDNYLVGIAEMPSNWGDNGGYEALKAQAMAARTYALNYTNNLSGSICVTEACQVYKRSKYQNPGTWRRAVEETRGVVIKSNRTGRIFSTMYASTAGGAINSYTSADYSTPQIWDSSCGNFSCWPNDAYEKQIPSPWFYKGWYKSRSNASCGRSHPWLTKSEFNDILNAILYYSKTHDSSHLSQFDTGGCFGGRDANSWSPEELARQVGSQGGPITSINSINVDYSVNGYSRTVRVASDKGDFNFSGDEFKQIFTLRAPGAITIKSSLFNIERK